MTQISTEDLKNLDIERLQSDEPISIISMGRAVAVLLTADLMEEFEDYLEARAVEREIEAADRDGTIPWDEVKKRLSDKGPGRAV